MTKNNIQKYILGALFFGAIFSVVPTDVHAQYWNKWSADVRSKIVAADDSWINIEYQFMNTPINSENPKITYAPSSTLYAVLFAYDNARGNTIKTIEDAVKNKQDVFNEVKNDIFRSYKIGTFKTNIGIFGVIQQGKQSIKLDGLYCDTDYQVGIVIDSPKATSSETRYVLMLGPDMLTSYTSSAYSTRTYKCPLPHTVSQTISVKSMSLNGTIDTVALKGVANVGPSQHASLYTYFTDDKSKLDSRYLRLDISDGQTVKPTPQTSGVNSATSGVIEGSWDPKTEVVTTEVVTRFKCDTTYYAKFAADTGREVFSRHGLTEDPSEEKKLVTSPVIDFKIPCDGSEIIFPSLWYPKLSAANSSGNETNEFISPISGIFNRASLSPRGPFTVGMNVGQENNTPCAFTAPKGELIGRTYGNSCIVASGTHPLVTEIADYFDRVFGSREE